MDVVEEVFELFSRYGQEAYFGESVSILDHSLQTAAQSARAGAPDELVTAALLHDVGHLLHRLPEDIAEHGIDGRHEEIGYAWLRSRFGPAVTEPVRLHVEAKRYLCFAEPEYLDHLSVSSLKSLGLQGGPQTAEQARGFERNSHFHDSVALRRWDDEAKYPGLPVPALQAYGDVLSKAVKASRVL